MKTKYIVFRRYNGMDDGYISIVNGKTWIEYRKDLATPMSLKKASKLCFQRNKELRDNYSYGYIYGYIQAD